MNAANKRRDTGAKIMREPKYKKLSSIPYTLKLAQIRCAGIISVLERLTNQGAPP